MASDSYQDISAPGTGWGTGAAAVKADPQERRAHQRYDFVADFDLFHLWGANHLIWAGAGKTKNWSRTSILLDWDQPLEAGSSVELVVRWSHRAQLVVVGRVLSCDARGTVVRILRRRFRTKQESQEIRRGTGPPPAQSESA